MRFTGICSNTIGIFGSNILIDVFAESKKQGIPTNGVVFDSGMPNKSLIKPIPASDKIFIDDAGNVIWKFSFNKSSYTNKSFECKYHLIKEAMVKQDCFILFSSSPYKAVMYWANDKLDVFTSDKTELFVFTHKLIEPFDIFILFFKLSFKVNVVELNPAIISSYVTTTSLLCNPCLISKDFVTLDSNDWDFTSPYSA